MAEKPVGCGVKFTVSIVTMSSFNEKMENSEWNSRSNFLMVMFCQSVGFSNISIIPSYVLSNGSTGCILLFILIFIIMGIPLLNMELVISQYSCRDMLDVWKARPCMSHCGYIMLIWLVCNLLYNHVLVSFVIHYFLISFESPIPYNHCGPWANSECDITAFNYTVNQNCIKQKVYDRGYCQDLHKSFPQYQYRQFNLLKADQNDGFYLAWRVSLASALASTITYLSCFRRHKSLQWVIKWFTFYPKIGYIVLVIGSMLQKGIVEKHEEVFDTEFNAFSKHGRFSFIILLVVYSLGIGSGLAFNFGASSKFRSPCYTNSVIIVMVAALFTTLILSTSTLASCPFAFEYGLIMESSFNTQISFLFEKMPMLFQQYDFANFYLIVLFSSNALVGLRSSVTIFFNILELFIKRNKKAAKYPGLTAFISILLMYTTTIPLLSCYGIFEVGDAFRRFMILIPCFMAIVECIVFVIMYGVTRFSEDVHFMLGIQPSVYMRLSWLVSVPLLVYTLCQELCFQYSISKTNKSDIIGWAVFLFFSGAVLVILLLKLLLALCAKNITKVVQLHPTWGPKSELLVRSRGTFTAKAITKEYMYRQYHLQAGILARQQRSNLRAN